MADPEGEGGTNSVGSVFRLSGDNYSDLTTLHQFALPDGIYLTSNLLVDSAGDIFGATETGGPDGDGTVFKLSGPNQNTFAILSSFGPQDGVFPGACLAVDAAGNLYGTTGGITATAP